MFNKGNPVLSPIYRESVTTISKESSFNVKFVIAKCLAPRKRVMIWSTPTAKSGVKVLGNERYLGYLVTTTYPSKAQCRNSNRVWQAK